MLTVLCHKVRLEMYMILYQVASAIANIEYLWCGLSMLTACLHCRAFALRSHFKSFGLQAKLM